MANNIYSELFEQLPIPERLEPENIAKMLEENASFSKKRSGIVMSEAVTSENNTSKKTAQNKSHSATYRAIMSVAACAVLVLGLVRYLDVGNAPAISEENHGATAAEDYDELHKTFQKYYVDEDDKMSLDSAIAEIEHSYNDQQSENETDEVEPDKTPEVTLDTPVETPPAVSEPIPPEEDVVIDDEPEEEEHVVIEDEFVLPELVKGEENVFIFSDKIFIVEGDTVKFIKTSNGELSYSDVIAPICADNETKDLIDFYVYDNRLTLVYAVETAVTVTSDVPEVDAEEDSEMTVLDELLGNVYAEEEETAYVRRSVEVKVYDLSDGIAYPVATNVQSGRFVDAVQSGSSVYVITAYDDYRLSPMLGASDLESYVPYYSLNGEKTYIQANDIVIPAYISNTDYTVIGGIDMSASEISVSVKALLGDEGRILMTDSAVYVFGYENVNGVDNTAIQMFDLDDGKVSLGTSIFCEGVALSGDGVTEMNGAIVVSALKNIEGGFITSVNVFDSALNLVSKCDFPAVLTTAVKDGNVLALSGSQEYAIDLANPAIPNIADYAKTDDVAENLVPLGNGYAVLTDINGVLTLANVEIDADGVAHAKHKIAIYEGEYTSKALSDNSVMYVNSELGIVGVPYGYYDGYDFCYRYVLYHLEGDGFKQIGLLESHEMDTVFEFGKAIEDNGLLYIFSEGRIYSTVASETGLAYVGSVNLIESTYGGHIEW